ncbi:MAG: sulfatase-like hydrolase/transferase [Bacteroidales bacterium]|nr:sulfatase-like hydrolase/transferase [Bacteroidales bacterium]
MGNYQTFISFQKKLLKVIISGIILFTLFRIVFMFRYGDMATIKEYSKYIWKIYFTGFRFDVQTLTYLFLPCFLVSFLLLLIKRSGFVRGMNKTLIYYSSIIYTVLTFALLADQQFYANFKQHYNTVLFDFFREEPLVLMKSIWQEHPVIMVFLITAAVYYGIFRLTKRIVAKTKDSPKKHNIILKIASVLTIFGIYAIAMRGSLGTFPLQLKVINISDNEFINQCVPNGIFMFKEAYKEAKNDFTSEDERAIYKMYGFKNMDEALSLYFALPVDSLKNKSLDDLVYKTAPKNDSIIHPNIIFILVESWSNQLIDFDNENVDLLCSMKQHLKDDILFRNFQSSANGTLSSLENLILSSPYHPVFDSKYRYIASPASIAMPFKEAGYETNFITGLALNWRHLNEAMPVQGFDNAIGKNTILNEKTDAKSNETWGIYDHYVLDYIFDKHEKAEKPQFTLCLTTTSHTPFELPPDYELPEFSLTPDMLAQFCVEEKIAHDYLTAFQYSNRALGDFMTKIKNSELKTNTIVIVTGDHNVRSIIPYNTPETLRYKNAVPLYIYLPENIRENLVVNTDRWASHYDIFSSIIPLVLSDTKYFAMGQNIFDTTANSNTFYSINQYSIFHNDGLTDEEANRIVNARMAITRFYYNQLFKKAENEKN